MVRIWRAGDQLSILERWMLDEAGIAWGRREEKPTLQHIKANAAQLVDVGVKNLGQEANLGRNHRVVVREEEFELESAT